MKKSILFLFAIFALSTTSYAQRGLKIAYVDMDYILKNVPEYQQASTQLDAKAQKWKSEIEVMRNKIDDMKQTLENERPLLTKELIEEREEEIAFEEKKMLDYQQEKFGPQGSLIVSKRQLVQPVQDQVFNAIQEIGLKREYDYIFENSSNALMLFSADRHDISDQVLTMIGRNARLSKNEIKEQEEEKYKSVEQAREDNQEEAQRQQERQEREDERNEMLNERQRMRDSIRQARQAEYEERRRKLLEDRQRRRDSIEQARNNNR
ncbi:OmpH family outer membrane protein [Mesonia sp. K7]|uniref:OmpH family outer membrane protein n=1 Tax=Mesonia sp. K7 TaxID=2218606 RepID=UPI000DA7B1D8|nr:OmpH family outer membrane protein [Mesonia sp. K7]PZD78739.1 OmpH family outer membrane protein [Mesonia sp. K7]